MVSYDNLPEDPLERSTEIDRRIEAAIAKSIERRRINRRVVLIVAVLLGLGLCWFGYSRMTEVEVGADDHLASATAHRDRGDLVAAAAALERALALDPTRLGARRMLGDVALELGDADSARKQFLLASPDGRSRVVKLGLFQASLMVGQYDRVLNQTTELLEHVRNEDLELVRVQSLIGLGRMREARAELDKLLLRFDKHIGALYISARLHLLDGADPDAAQQLERIAPSETVLLDLLKAETALAGDQPRQARSIYDRLAVDRPNHPEVLLGQVRTYLTLGNLANAEKALARLENLGSESDSTTYLRAALEQASGHLEAARDRARQLLERVPGHLDARLLLARIAYASNDFPKARNLLEPVTPNLSEEVASVQAQVALAAGDPKAAVSIVRAWRNSPPRALSRDMAETLERAQRQLGDEDAASASAAEAIGAPEAPTSVPLAHCAMVVHACRACEMVRACFALAP